MSETLGNAPRVTPADLEAEIASEHYFTAGEGAAFQSGPIPDSLHLLTFCVLVLRNGFTVVGKAACVSVANFNAEIGRRVAREDAIDQLWPLLGFRLADNLHAATYGSSEFTAAELAEATGCDPGQIIGSAG